MNSKNNSTEIKVSAVHDEPACVIANFFKGFNAPRDTECKLYKKRKHVDIDDIEDSKQQPEYLLHGENERLEYDASSNNFEPSQYIVGIYNPKEKKIELYKAPFVSNATVIAKSKKYLSGPKIKQAKDVRASTMRNALGEAFGTKKAKKAIADLERNRVDATKLADNVIDIVDSVNIAVQNLPTRQQLDDNIERPIPACNVDATDVENVYPISSIIPKKEWQFIRCNSIMKETDLSLKLELLPYSKGQYITKKLGNFNSDTPMRKWQLLYYLSLLLGVYDNRRSHSKEKLLEKLNGPPDALVDGILDRFTILKPGVFGRSKDRSFVIDPQNEDKLLCYILCCILHLDNFMVEITPLAQELGMKPSRLVALFRTLGCIVKGATVSQAEAFNIPKSTAASYKIATLKVPFKLPEMARRGRRRQ
ncbi:probable DNA-directed RNA polymerase I subunit RPA49 [Saccharomycodes ludwigii]|uniref:Probable DNA-directed RNA polymerase I subunit RPA49 n=1 Tax=Saccharomycodes ludwigii TaxID=36035 RepID=A0A376B6D7_9ASCO|nr:hypothetical protein SCDLUD_003924 [Saccharomycodes ludwigii]KAH3899643.1 hypothetical protein SCDLUD_003924 [Saccharomycodes ludwigii]SSD60034.1 probable DNA-directed RNA polymerase I subunit RPA49 [Saccharomycodes ludwigii]